MADDEDPRGYVVEYAKSGRSKCKLASCKAEGSLIPEGSVRVGTIVKNTFSSKEDAVMTVWWHPDCLFEHQKRGRASKKKITSIDEIEGFGNLKKVDADHFRENIESKLEDAADIPKVFTYMEHTTGSKWWKIGLNSESTTTTVYAKTGEEEFTLLKEHADRPAAEKYLAKMIKDKTKGGYEEKAIASAAAAAPPTEGKPKPAPAAPVKAEKEKAKPKTKKATKDAAAAAPSPEVKVEVKVEVKAESSSSAAGGAGGAADEIKGFRSEYAKSGRSSCKHCTQKIEEKTLRLAKLIQNPFTDKEQIMPQWYHVECLFTDMKKGKQNKSKLTDASVIEGWDDLTKEDKELLQERVAESSSTAQTVGAEKELGVHLRCTDKGANKFWEISLQADGLSTQTRWGDISLGFSEGNYVQKDFPTAPEAVVYKDGMIKKKLKSGGYYVWSLDGVKVEEGARESTAEELLSAAAKPAKKRKTDTEEAPAAKKERGESAGDVSGICLYQSMTLAQLKAVLKAKGLEVSGKKADLVARLLE